METKRRGKIKKPPAPEAVKYIDHPGMLNDMSLSYQTILDINKAHVLMLAEEGIIAKEAAKEILRVTRDMANMQDNPKFALSHDVEDVFFLMERYLIEQVGIEIGGQQHTARSRNDMGATKHRIDSRKCFLLLCDMLLDLRRALLEQAAKNVDTVMSGYTHLQPSEPITFGHYCSALLHALERDYTRLSRTWDSLNICPLGACAMAGTTFAINRQTTSDLLGFDAPTGNALDSVGGRDFAMEMVGALALMANTMSRLAQDLYVWATMEFGYIEVDDSVAICSSIMPQKKNPSSFESVRGKAGHIGGFWSDIFSGLKNVAYTNSRDVFESLRYFHTALYEAEASLALMTVTIRTMMVRKERMENAAKENFCTVTELANYLVRNDGFSFRAAHEIVALLVEYMTEHDKKANEITQKDLDPLCRQLFSKGTTLTDAQIAQALDPAQNAKSKKVLGGPAPEEVRRQLDVLEKRIKADAAELAARQEKVQKAKAMLEGKIDAILA